MKPIRDYLVLTRLGLLMNRDYVWFIGIVQIAFSVGIVLGFGYLIPDISNASALYITIGAATQSMIVIGLVGAPQLIAQAKFEGRLDYFRSLPLSREAYLLSNITVVLIQSIPGIIFAIILGAWRYDLSLSVDPMVLPVVLLAVLSLAGAGVAMAVLSPHLQLTNAITQLLIFYVVFFAPVLIPASQLPQFLQVTADYLPPTYAADAMRATLTDLPAMPLAKSMGIMAAFSAASIAAASVAMRWRA